MLFFFFFFLIFKYLYFRGSDGVELIEVQFDDDEDEVRAMAGLNHVPFCLYIIDPILPSAYFFFS